jgi:hypothetical protein
VKPEDLVGTWFQVSAKFRLVRRLPAGKSGKQALYEATKLNGTQPDPEHWVAGMTEQSAGNHYLRCCGNRDELELSVEEWAAYKAAGGGTYDGRFQPDLGRVLFTLVHQDKPWDDVQHDEKTRWTEIARTVRLA